MKAVLWTDTLQSLLMVSGLVAVIITGVIKEGGIGNIWEVNRMSGRLDFME